METIENLKKENARLKQLYLDYKNMWENEREKRQRAEGEVATLEQKYNPKYEAGD